MLGIAPFSEKNVAVGQLFEKRFGPWFQPLSELLPLPRTWKMQVRASILGADISLGVKRNTKIRPVHLFFNDKFMPKEIIPLGSDMTLSPLTSTLPRSARCGVEGNLKKSSFTRPSSPCTLPRHNQDTGNAQ